MKKLGLVGGMGLESTIPYYHDIVYGVQKQNREKYLPKLNDLEVLYVDHSR